MKIEFDETNATVARAVGRALLEIAGAHPTTMTVSISPEVVTPEQVFETLSQEYLDNGAPYAAGTATVKESEFGDSWASGAALAADEKPHQDVGAIAKGMAAALTEQAFGSDCCPSHDVATDAEFGKVLHQVADSLRVDQHGVHFDDRYCGEAEEPFYTSGKMRGQWKKRRGVEEFDYVTWYESQRPKPAPEGVAPAVLAADPAPLPVQNVAAAFGAPVAPVAKPLPANAGELMAWAAELQAAGRLTQPDITAAYAELGLALFDIFESATVPAALAQERIGKLYALLSAKAGV